MLIYRAKLLERPPLLAHTILLVYIYTLIE